jgi:hypothetical protein
MELLNWPAVTFKYSYNETFDQVFDCNSEYSQQRKHLHFRGEQKSILRRGRRVLGFSLYYFNSVSIFKICSETFIVFHRAVGLIHS